MQLTVSRRSENQPLGGQYQSTHPLSHARADGRTRICLSIRAPLPNVPLWCRSPRGWQDDECFYWHCLADPVGPAHESASPRVGIKCGKAGERWIFGVCGRERRKCHKETNISKNVSTGWFIINRFRSIWSGPGSRKADSVITAKRQRCSYRLPIGSHKFSAVLYRFGYDIAAFGSASLASRIPSRLKAWIPPGLCRMSSTMYPFILAARDLWLLHSLPRLDGRFLAFLSRLIFHALYYLVSRGPALYRSSDAGINRYGVQIMMMQFPTILRLRTDLGYSRPNRTHRTA